MSGRMGRVVRFGISGGLSAATLLAAFHILTDRLGVWYVAAGALAWLISLAVNFLLQRNWTFRAAGGARGQAAAFLALGLVNAAINAALLYGLVDLAGLPKLPAQALLTLVIAAWNYAVMRRLIFRVPPEERSAPPY